jgi:hypothetical protein
VDAAGNAYVTGSTASTNFPTVAPLQPVFAGGTCGLAPNTFQCAEAFVTKLNSTGSALLYSTYLGGSAGDRGSGIAVDTSGNAYITGSTDSTNFPTVSPLQAVPGGSGDAFVAKLNAAGSALLYSTYLGGNFGDSGSGIAVDSSGNAYVTGSTSSTNFPTANPLHAAPGGSGDAFVAKLNATGSALMYSTYLGGSGIDQGSGIAVDSSGNAYITGSTDSRNFPTVNPIQAVFSGDTCLNTADSSPCFDVFVAKLNAAGSALAYSTYLGGSAGPPGSRDDEGSGIAIDSSGNAYITGGTNSTNFPTVNPLQAARGGAFVAKITSNDAPGIALGPASLTFAGQAVSTSSSAQTVTLASAGSTPLEIVSIVDTGDFAQTNNCPSAPNTLAGGTNCTIDVTFTPTSTGTRTGALTISDNAAGSPHTVSLTGTTGQPDFSVSIASGSSASATLPAGQTATYNLNFSGTNGFSGTVSLSCSDTANASNCSASPDSITVNGNNLAAASVKVATMARALVLPGLRPPPLSLGPGLRVTLPWLLLLLSLALLAPSLRWHGGRCRSAWRGLGAVVVFALVLFGCGGSSSNSPPPAQGTQAGSYSITVNATSGSVSHSMVLHLTVQ